jgi:hypothetical protein
VGHTGEHGRSVEDPLQPRRGIDRTAALKRGSTRDGVVDQLAHDLELLLGDHRPDLRVPPDRVADPQPLRTCDELLGELVGDLPQHVHPLDPRTRLSGVGEPAPQRPRYRVVDVRVGEHDHRVLAAELEHRPLELARALLANASPGLDRAGEEHFGDARGDQRRAGTGAVDDAHQSFGHSGALKHPPDPLTQQRRQRSRLEHDTITGHQRDRDLAKGNALRIVPRGNDPDHAERLVGERRLLGLQEQLRHRDRGALRRCRFIALSCFVVSTGI